MKPDLPTIKGTITSAHGRHYAVELADGSIIMAYPRGRATKYACGDECVIDLSGAEGRIIAIDDRSSIFWRSDTYKQKLIAANVTMLVMVVATDLPINHSLITRCLIAAEQQRIKAKILVNKSDLGLTTSIKQFITEYTRLGYDPIDISAITDTDAILKMIKNERVVLIGQSGVGKSTIVNNITDTAYARTASISAKLRTGRHTTTHAQLYKLDETTSIIDCPGLQSFGLKHIEPQNLANYFSEFLPYLNQCQFDNCTHTVEPNCKVIDAVNNELIKLGRWKEYKKILSEIRR
ncbi:MAG: ribosome small subunit-dependent GTPase A [Betaproteobacteria bacterium TMED22]|nr:MAG: ribosome small subunit-dependent GTPase A [Betaproteobacteria bacterium TMED22]